MFNIWTIAKREYKAYSSSLTAYLFAFIILLVIGVIFFISISSVMSGMGQTTPPGMDIVLYPVMFLLVFSCPAFTMRLISEENRQGTWELLMTAPVRDAEIVIGKWLGSFMFVATLIGMTVIYPLALHLMTNPGIDQGPMVTGYIGLLLVSGAFLAMGVAISAMLSNQVASYILTLGVIIMFWWILGFFTQAAAAGSVFSTIFQFMNMQSHFYESMTQGILPLSGVVYYLSFVVFSLMLATVVVETRRWR